MIHSLAWLSWLVAVLLALSVLHNPLHLVLVLLCILVVHSSQRLTQGLVLPYTQHPLRLIVTLTVLAALMNALSSHFGQTVVLGIPDSIPLLGGPITLEALVFGALSGMTLAGMILAFGIVQRALPTSMLISLIPRAFYPLAIVSAIAISFIPTTLQQAAQIREAQQIRGAQFRRLRDWLPLLIPLLISGLESAIQLAESIAARGFASTDRKSHMRGLRLTLVAGLLLVLSGWLLVLVWGLPQVGQWLMLLGSGILLVLLGYVGRQLPHSRYREQHWRRIDNAILIGVAVTLMALVFPWPGIDRSVLGYYPYPQLRLPPFDPVLGFASLGLLWPASVKR